jgi:hypothetical protein
MFSRTLTLATVGIAGIAMGSQKVTSANDSGELQGKWTAVRAEQDGREAVDIVGHLLVFDGGKFSEKSRPTSFGTKPDSGLVLVVFKRARQ